MSLSPRDRWSRLLSKGVELPHPASRATKGELGFVQNLAGYSKATFKFDLIAAMTLLAIAVPEQLATARLAGMPVITGLYLFIVSSVLFALLGSNPQMSIGADSTIAPLFAVAITRIAAIDHASYLTLINVLAVETGLIVALVGVLRMGWVAEFLSKPIITGFMGGVAIIIMVHQLPDLLGVASVSGSNLHRVAAVTEHLSHTHPWTLALALGVFVVVYVAERIDRRIPGALVGVVAATLIVGLAHLSREGVSILGSVPHGLPRFGIAGLSLHLIEAVFPVALVVALVVISQSAATSRAFADLGHYRVDVGRDFVGIGAGSMLAGIIGSFPGDASPARTAAVASSGGRTQMTGLLAAGAMVAVVPAIGLLRNLPLAALAAVLVFIATRIFHGRDFLAIAHFDLFEFALAMITLLAVAFVGVEQGIIVAIALAVIDRTRLSIQPQLHVLGRVPGTTSWIANDVPDNGMELPGVLVTLFATPLWYANASHFRDEIEAAIAEHLPELRLVVLDVVGMSDLDFTGAATLRQVVEELHAKGVAFAIARSGQRVRAGLERSGLTELIGEDHLFPSVDLAVLAADLSN